MATRKLGRVPTGRSGLKSLELTDVTVPGGPWLCSWLGIGVISRFENICRTIVRQLLRVFPVFWEFGRGWLYVQVQIWKGNHILTEGGFVSALTSPDWETLRAPPPFGRHLALSRSRRPRVTVNSSFLRQTLTGMLLSLEHNAQVVPMSYLKVFPMTHVILCFPRFYNILYKDEALASSTTLIILIRSSALTLRKTLNFTFPGHTFK